MTPLMLWAGFGLAPVVLTIILGMRNHIIRSADANADYNDVVILLKWLMPGFAIVAGASMKANGAAPVTATWSCVLPYLAFFLISDGFLRLPRKQGALHSISLKVFFQFLGHEFGTIFGFCAYILISAWSEPGDFSFDPTVRLFATIVFISWILGGVVNRYISRAFFWSKLERLAPCDLYRRVQEVAELCNTEIEKVTVLRNLPYLYVNAMASSRTAVVLSEDLIKGLRKDEVDAVIAHEVGHLADKTLWWLSAPVYYTALVLWFGLMLVAENKIESLPTSLHFLQTVKWFCLFLVPSLMFRLYCRTRERKAESSVSVLDDSRATISSYYKLSALNSIPMNRPWWSRILSTHPPLSERIREFALEGCVSENEIAAIFDQAAREIRDGGTEHYEPVYYNQSKEELVNRKAGRWKKIALATGCTAAGLALWIAGFVVKSPMYTDAQQDVLVLTFIPFIAFCVLMPSWTYNRRWSRNIRPRLREALRHKYAEQETRDMLLVDTLLYDDWDKLAWQAALIGVSDGCLDVLAETRKLCLSLNEKITITQAVSAGNARTFSLSQGAVVVEYDTDGVTQRIAFSNVGQPEKGLPQNRKQLASYINTLLAEADVALPQQKRSPVRMLQRLACFLLAVLIAVAAALLVEMIMRVFGLDQLNWGIVPHYIIGGLAFSSAKAWLDWRQKKAEKNKTAG